MKKIHAIVVLSLFLGVVSCKKTDNMATNSATTNSVTTDQVADMSAGSISLNSNGLATTSNDIASAALSNEQGCGTTATDSTFKFGSSNNISYDYFVKYTHTLTCNSSNQHDNIASDVSFHGYYASPTILSLDTGTSSFKIAGFTTQATTFLINGEYKRTGKFNYKVGNKTSGTSSIDIVVANLTVDKSTKNIISGTSTITISATTTKGTFNFSGPLTFNGGSTATLVLNGTTYSINLITGLVTKQ